MHEQVHALSGYHLGPVTKTSPQFATDASHRKKVVGQLSTALERMNRVWKDAEDDRELATRARATRNRQDVLEYTHVDTGERIASHVYEATYLKLIGAGKVDPVLRLLPVTRPSPTAASASTPHASPHLETASTFRASPAPGAASADAAARARSLGATFGLDLSSSCVVDAAFYERGALLFSLASCLSSKAFACLSNAHTLVRGT